MVPASRTTAYLIELRKTAYGRTSRVRHGQSCAALPQVRCRRLLAAEIPAREAMQMQAGYDCDDITTWTCNDTLHVQMWNHML